MPKVERRLKYQDAPTGATTHSAVRGGTYDSGLYVRVDGTRKMTADWDAGDYTITSDIFDADTAFYYGGVHILSGLEDNVLLGEGAGASIYSGIYNFIGGYHAGNKLYDGVENVIIGNHAAENAIDDSWNVIIGGYAMSDSTSSPFGSYENVAVGYYAMEDADDVTGNVAVGAYSLRRNTGGEWNVAIGHEALELGVTVGDNNVAVGYLAGQGCEASNNTFIGSYAGAEAHEGTGLTMVGYYAGSGGNYTDADYNTLIGYYAGAVVQGGGNTFVGANSGKLVVAGALNCIVGYDSGKYLVSGIGNSFLGTDSGGDCTGSENTFLGHQAGYTGKAWEQSGDYNIGIGPSCASSLSTGEGNVLVGYSTGSALTTQSNNVMIGHSAGSLSTSAASVFIGQRAGRDETRDNTLYIHNSESATPLIYGEFDNDEVGINIGAGCAGTLHVDQASTSGAKPVLYLDQADVDEEFIRFDGTSAADQTKSISTVNGDGAVEGPKNFSASAGWAFEGMVRVNINGTDYWMPYYSADTS